MIDKLVKDFMPLEASEEATALLAVIPDLGAALTHKQMIAENAASLVRLSPTPIATQRVPLVTFTGVDVDNRASATVPNALHFREKRVRHSFADGYESLMAVVFLNSSTQRTEVIHISEWNASTEDAPIALKDGFEIWKLSETGFGFTGSQSSTKYLAGLYGYGAVFKPPEVFDAALRFEQSLNTFTLVSGRASTLQLPDAVGGTPPYTYALEGTALPGTLIYYPNDLQIRGRTTGRISGLRWRVTDVGGETYFEDFSITVHSALSIGNISGSYSLPESAQPNNGSVTLPSASGGVPPYTYTFIPTSEVYTTVDGLTAYITVTRHGSTVNFVVSGSGDLRPREGESLSVGFSWRVRDSVGQTAQRDYSVQQDNYDY